MSSFGTDFCGLIADGVGPTRSSAHPPARSFELRDKCVVAHCLPRRGILDGSVSSFHCCPVPWDVFVAVHFCMHVSAFQDHASLFEDSFCGNGSIACCNCSGFYSPAKRGNGYFCSTLATNMSHWRKRSSISLLHDDDAGHADDYDMWSSGVCYDQDHSPCSLFSCNCCSSGTHEPYIGSYLNAMAAFFGSDCSYSVQHYRSQCGFLPLQPRTGDHVFRAKSVLGGLSVDSCFASVRFFAVELTVLSCSAFLLSATPSVRSVAFEVAMFDFLLVLAMMGYGEGFLLPTKVYPLATLGSEPTAISFLARDVGEIVHCWHYGCFSFSQFEDSLPTPLFGWPASQFGEMACLGVLFSSVFLITGILIAYVGSFPDFFGGFEGFHEAKEEDFCGGELRDFEDDEIAQEVGEFCPPGAALFVRANSLRDPPPGLGGMAKDSAGLSHAVYPPILVLARQSFFKPSPRLLLPFLQVS